MLIIDHLSLLYPPQLHKMGDVMSVLILVLILFFNALDQTAASLILIVVYCSLLGIFAVPYVSRERQK